MKPKSRSSRPQDSTSKPFASTSSSSSFNYTNIAIWAGIFILGIGVGIAFSSGASVNPENVVSREVIDRSAPNAELCVQYGASAMVTDMRVFVTLNPFNVYVTQPSMRPGCVLRRNNWAVLEQKQVVSAKQVRECKNRLNTFGFTGDLDSNPDIECIYQNEAADNFFLKQPGTVGPRPETDRF
ncbi:MAG: DUF3172 domain-containing protein [Symploca sp. SIO2E6]|nr:DUF3172 domain-containing protein [Symploca sp. SIO2E6]